MRIYLGEPSKRNALRRCNVRFDSTGRQHKHEFIEGFTKHQNRPGIRPIITAERGSPVLASWAILCWFWFFEERLNDPGFD